MPKVFNRATQVGGEDLKVGTSVVTVKDMNASGYVTKATGKTKPTDGDAGFARGCEFTRLTDETTGNTGPRTFFNIGTHTKAKFVPVANSKTTFEEFRSRPVSADDAGYGNPTGTGGDVNTLQTDSNHFEYHIKGTQTILAPAFDATNGLNIAMDQTNNDGVELSQGVGARSKSAFVVGTDPAFYFSVTLKPADVSGSDDLAVGFHKAEAYQANVDDYDEAAFLNVISGAIKIETILNNAATVTTDTTQTLADATAVTLTVKVSATGAVTYEINGAAPTVTAPFTFDSGEVVVPFLFFLNDTDLMDTLYLTKWEVGYQ